MCTPNDKCAPAPRPPKHKKNKKEMTKELMKTVLVFGEPRKSWSMDKSTLLLNSWKIHGHVHNTCMARNTFLILNTYQDRLLASSAVTFPTMVAGSATKLVAWVW